MYKLIAADFDNTLCNYQKVVTKRTREAIDKFQKQGGIFVIATTRPYFAIDKIARDIGLNSYLIASQGASIRELRNNDYFYKNFLTKEDASKILQFINEKACKQVLLFSDENIYLTKKDIFYDRFSNEMPFNTQVIGKDVFENSENLDIAQIMVGSLSEKLLIKKMNKWRMVLGETYDIGLCDRHVLNFVKKGVSKGKAVEILAKKFDIKKDEIVTFGDSENDKSLFEYSGIGVAMGNSMSLLKEKATFVCDDCQHDGLAKFMEENILK